MKCPNCGAETSGTVCEFCNCELPKPEQHVTVTNNYYGTPATQSQKKESALTCPTCGGNQIRIRREDIGSEKTSGRKSAQTVKKHRTVAICESCGNTWTVNQDGEEKKKRSVWFWILAFCFWSIALDVWFYKTPRIKLEKKWRILIIAASWILLFVLAGISGSGTSDAADPTEPATQYSEDAVSRTAEATTETASDAEKPAEKEATSETAVPLGHKNALEKAKSYLSFSAFSYSGLIKQLEFEGFSTEEATYGADNCGADWNEQAAKKAQSYLDFSSFSKSGLIEQLEFEGFTHEQAEYGAQAVGY